MPTPALFQIPQSLTPFFQEYHLENLDLQDSAPTIIERVLQYGNRTEIGWLFQLYPRSEIKKWIRQWGEYALPEPHLTFWNVVLDLEKQADEN